MTRQSDSGRPRARTSAGPPVGAVATPSLGVRLRSRAGVALLTTAVFSSMISSFDAVAVNVTVPAIASDLGKPLTSIQWVVTGYLLTAASLLLLSGVLIDRFGPRRVLAIGLSVLLAGSMLCAIAPGTDVLVAGRLIQGVGSAMVVPSSVAMLNGNLHVDDRDRGLGVWAGLSTLGLTAGPSLGGWLADQASWRHLFLVNLPMVLVALTLLSKLPDIGARRHLSLDLVGALLAVGGLGGVTYALAAGPTAGWVSAPVVVGGVVGLVFLSVLVPVERRRRDPMLRLSLFGSREFVAANVTTALLLGVLAAAAYLLGLQCQLRLGYSAAEAGAVLVPVSVVFLALSTVVSNLVARSGPRRPVMGGVLAIAAALMWLSRVSPGDSYVPSLLPGALLWGAGLAFTVAPLTAAALGSAGDQDVGQASAINNTAAQVGVLVLVTLAPVLLGVGGGDIDRALANNYQSAILALIGLAVPAALVSSSFLSSRPTSAPQLLPMPQVHACVPFGESRPASGPETGAVPRAS